MSSTVYLPFYLNFKLAHFLPQVELATTFLELSDPELSDPELPTWFSSGVLYT